MRLGATAVFLVIVAGGALTLSLLLNGATSSQQFPSPHGFGTQGNYGFGTNSSSYEGWLIPSNTLVTTSFVTTNSLNHYVSANLNVFPYQQTGTLYLGLYINGVLEANDTHNLNNSHAQPATLLQNVSIANGAQLSVFSHSLEGYSIYFALQNSVPSGARLTVSVFATNPLWVQDADNSSTTSSEITTSNPLPLTLQSISKFTPAPYTPIVQVDSDEK